MNRYPKLPWPTEPWVPKPKEVRFCSLCNGPHIYNVTRLPDKPLRGASRKP